MKDTRPINVQVEELTPDERKTVVKVFKTHLSICVSLLAIYIIAVLSGGLLIAGERAKSDSLYDKFISCETEEERLIAEVAQKDEEIADIDTNIQALKLEEAKYTSKKFSFENGDLEVKELTQEEKQRLSDITIELLKLDGEKLELLTERRDIQKTLDLATSDKASAFANWEESLDKRDEMSRIYNIAITIGIIVLAIVLIALEIFTNKKYPFYSEKKYRYIKKMQKSSNRNVEM